MFERAERSSFRNDLRFTTSQLLRHSLIYAFGKCMFHIIQVKQYEIEYQAKMYTYSVDLTTF